MKTKNHTLETIAPQSARHNSQPRALWSTLLLLTPCLLALLALVFAAGCASTKVSNQQQTFSGVLPKPDHIWVYDFVATGADVPSDSPLVGESNLDMTPQSDKEIAEGRKLGSQIANQLAQEIRAMGLPGATAWPGMKPQPNDIILRGYLLTVKQGSAGARVLIGFGAGGSEVRTMVAGFQVQADGQQRMLGSGTIDAKGNKTPGAALGLATFLATKNPAGLILSSGMKVYGEASGSDTVEGRAKATAKEIGDLLKKRFVEQGWISGQ